VEIRRQLGAAVRPIVFAARVVRIPLTVKVSESVYQRLREASFREETDKQDLVDQALDALLTKMGY